MPSFVSCGPCRIWVWAAILCVGNVVPANCAEPERVDFNRSIRPILSNICFKCHGPDHEERKGGLRLDLREEALKKLESGEAAIVPGKPEQSELVRRVLSTDDSERMPPPSNQKQLTATEKELLKRWVAEGGEYQQHWSFRHISRPARPVVKNAAWGRNAIDDFILAKLDAAGLKPSPDADKSTLIRRVTLDLTGLPPTPKEVDDFLADQSMDAYEKLIDRLMGTSQFAERMALDWLDVARYADTNGYHIDNGRDMTRWREWVIEAFAKNMPYDQFTIEQLAGDLLPNATTSQKIASGFNRNHMINFEGGAIPDEYHNAYIVDRVNTTGTVFLGLTVGCAQCHDHKYDPISQKEYYQLYSFFYNVPENGLDGNKGNAAPLIKAPTVEQLAAVDQLKKEIASLVRTGDAAAARGPVGSKGESSQYWSRIREDWEREVRSKEAPAWKTLDNAKFESSGGATYSVLNDGSLLLAGPNAPTDTYTLKGDLPFKTPITAIRLEVLPDESLPAKGPGRTENGNVVLTNVRFGVIDPKRPDRTQQEFYLASADYSQDAFAVANAIDNDPKSGWAIHPQSGKAHQAVFEFTEPIIPSIGMMFELAIEFQSQYAQHQPGRIRVSFTSSLLPHGKEQVPANIAQIVSLSSTARSTEQTESLNTYYRVNVSPGGRKSRPKIASLEAKIQEIEKTFSTAMVMQEMQKPRDAFILIRGQYDKKGDKVLSAVPASLPPLPANAPANRLGLAEWLTSMDHPLMSRVTVNRYWQLVFGTGLVKTADDFGSQGDQPSHPELLDWLAMEFMQPETNGGGAWNVRKLLKTMLLSSAYRQQSIVSRELLEKDPENRLLARGPRHRLQVEMIRDQALFVSGLLDRRVGGQSVSPYQPAGLWEELMSRADGKNWTAQEYHQSHGADLYRRTMYTFWKRTCPPPSLMTFDAPDRETCTVRRARTNTPLQALVLLNDPTYVEASRKLAERIMLEGGPTLEGRLIFAFRTVLARPPKPKEVLVLAEIHAKQLARFTQDEPAAIKLLSVGESKRNEQLAPAELATWATMASVLLNLDETVSKQ
jgi:hypothetical protein